MVCPWNTSSFGQPSVVTYTTTRTMQCNAHTTPALHTPPFYPKTKARTAAARGGSKSWFVLIGSPRGLLTSVHSAATRESVLGGGGC